MVPTPSTASRGRCQSLGRALLLASIFLGGCLEGDLSGRVCRSDDDCLTSYGYACHERVCVHAAEIRVWECDAARYADGEDCDCGCGLPDPDCGESYGYDDCYYDHCESGGPAGVSTRHLDPRDLASCLDNE